MRCTLCLSVVNSQWECPNHGKQRVILKAPSKQAVSMVLAGPIVFATTCKTCGDEFYAVQKRHRFCSRCLPAWAKIKQGFA
jgi:hypothetical protein